LQGSEDENAGHERFRSVEQVFSRMLSMFKKSKPRFTLQLLGVRSTHQAFSQESIGLQVHVTHKKSPNPLGP
jgi:hypothetical protein